MRIGAMKQSPWLAYAWSQLGQREIAGPRSNPRIAEYIRVSGHPSLADDATAWCAAFVGACLDNAGIAGTGSLMARSYLSWGSPAAWPEPGAIAVLSRGADPTFGHVGFLVGMTDDRVMLLGGNQSDAVTVEAFPRSRLLALRQPPIGPVRNDTQPSAPVAASAFEWSLARILEFEGGYGDDPFDPGGPTNKGITLAVYAKARGQQLSAENVDRLKSELRAIPDALVARIYLERYWRPAVCPDVSAGLAHFHFDAAVNQGVGTAARMLQEALDVAIDGEIGPITLRAAATRPPADTLRRYAAVRRRRYRNLQHFWRFGRGWLARVDRALDQSLSLLGSPAASDDPSAPPTVAQAAPRPLAVPPTGHLPSTPTLDKEPHPMPQSDSIVIPPAAAPSDAKWWGNSLTIWGALVTAVSTVAPALFAAAGLDIPSSLLERLGSDAVAVVQAVGGLVGTVMTIAGRVRATTRIERRPLAVRI